MNKLKKFFRTRWGIATIIVIILVVLGGVASAIRNGSQTVQLFTVKPGAITQVISVTGKTEPVNNVDLAFEQSGKVAAILAKPGDQVRAGQVLVRLDAGELAGELRQAQARVASEAARLAEVERGSRVEDVSISEAKLTSAKTTLENTRRDLTDKINDAYVKSDDALRAHADQFFSYPGLDFGVVFSDGSTNVTLSAPAGQTEQLRSEHLDSQAAVKKLQTLVSQSGDPINRAEEVRISLRVITTFMSNLAVAVNSFKTSEYKYQSTVDGYRTEVSTARSSVSAALTNLQSALQAYKNAVAGVEVAQKELNLKEAGSTKEAIALQRAALEEARGRVDVISAQLRERMLIAPFAGTLGKLDVKLGEQAMADTPVATVMSAGAWEIESQVPEVDIAKIHTGNKAEITVDAIPGQTFSGAVSQVDTAETMVEGIVNYVIKIAFAGNEADLKSGLTANVDIITAQKENVLIIPQAALVETEKGTFVNKVVGDQKSETAVTIGVRGRDGNVEIISGLEAGDQVESVVTVK